MRAHRPSDRWSVQLTVLVAALGYFVDIYDLILFSIVRVESLRSLGLGPAEVLDKGVLLLNMQMFGMLVGGIVWGVLGDRRGRLSVLFGSIILYSTANLANAFVDSVAAYAVWRFIAGVGLAGELGAGVTLVVEVMSRERRGYGTAIVASVGIMGAVAAALIGDWFAWRTAYVVGGFMGLALLVLRLGVYESGMFQTVQEMNVSRGNFFSLFSSPKRASRYLAVILVGVPIWYVVGILITFSPELGRGLGMRVLPDAGRAVMFCYIGLAVGDLASGWLSQWLGSRKTVLLLFMTLTAASVAWYFIPGDRSLTAFYTLCAALGVATGYWAVFVTVASEQFGTNLRATATTTAPNFVRGAVVLLTLTFRGLTPTMGVVMSAMLVGAVALIVAFVSLAAIEETYGKDLSFVES
jgi:predicted MFS family arabinose efflux permease